MNKDFSLKTTHSNILSITAYGLENISIAPCLIFVHGFKGFKDWGFYPFAGKYFSEKGFFVLTFNFSHNGIGSSALEFSEMDKFAKNTISLEISELNDLINAYNDGFFGNKKSNKIGLIGHSRGGAAVILSSLININPSAYVLWASVAKLDRYTERQKNEWKKSGYVEVFNSRTNQLMRMDVDLLKDIENNINGSLNMQNAVESLDKPLLIIHGEQDLTVPVSEAEQIYSWSNQTKTEIFKIPNTGHTFDIVHPFQGSNQKFDQIIDKTNDFLAKALN
ncbi:MAG: prolyl oligopeptidase family serine peptidase [Ignavibacteriaceae bacterium]